MKTLTAREWGILLAVIAVGFAMMELLHFLEWGTLL